MKERIESSLSMRRYKMHQSLSCLSPWVYCIKWMFAHSSTSALLKSHFLSWTGLCGLGPVRNRPLCASVSLSVAGCVCCLGDLWPGFPVRTLLASPDPVCSEWVTAAAVCPLLGTAAAQQTHTNTLSVWLIDSHTSENTERAQSEVWTGIMQQLNQR